MGVAFQSLKDGQTENIGYIIPTDVIHHFLDDVAKNGRYSGFCELGIELQRCENDALRACAGLSAAQTGLMVRVRVRVRVTRLMVKSVHPMCPLPRPYPLPLPLPPPGQERPPNVPAAEGRAAQR